MRIAAILPPRRTTGASAGARSSRRIKPAALALPLAAVLALPLIPTPAAESVLPTAHAQSDLPAGSGTDYLNPSNPPKRTPTEVTGQDLKGLPEGVSVDRVEWITDRWANVFINSAAMPGKPIKVQLLLARDWYSQPNRTFPTVWALDGLRAKEEESGWTIETNIASFYSDKNVNVVLPVGGESSFYTDWQQPDNGKHYKWETFLTKELPAVLREGWRSNDERAITGLSMGGTAAMNLAERFPQMWKFVGSFSGYLDVSSYGMPQAIDYATHDGGGYDAQKMWGPYGSQDWIDHDPKLGVEHLKNMSVYVSAGNGNTGAFDKDGPIPGVPENTVGMGLEMMSRMTTETFVNYAKRAGVNVVSKFRPSGTHSWPYWQFEMTQAWPYIANALSLPAGDRGAKCETKGDIGRRIGEFPQLGACISNEYDGADGGKIQDFRGGRAFWKQSSGAHFLWGRIGALYSSMNGTQSWLGYPLTEEIALKKDNGRFVKFENGHIYWTPQLGAVAVKNDFMKEWGKTGYENGPLGYPVAAERPVAGGAVQQFQNGVIVRKPDGSTQYVQGKIAEKYMELGGPESGLKWPKSDELDTPKNGKRSEFDGGVIYWSAETGAHSILNGAIRDAWAQEGFEVGRFGFPVADFAAIPAGGNEVKFQNGVIREINGHIQKDPQ
ncbi:hypothetical protein GSS87_03370 [Corynebacterium sp. 4HC-13]|uniref:alpha/beta hydrolase-fold protein n=1 Tax=Corynebacterium anserum TaxID=2684406 RepID=UPI00163AE610|nr:alpha/beta hydrolase-fold protein [Corynebacterium anserum]MBC2681445.1 hypothetical protein [Corynebacterium anserum]